MKRVFYQHGALLIGIAPVLVYCLSCLLFEINDDTAIKIKKLLLANVGKTAPTTALQIMEYKARVLWLCSSLLSICAYLVAIVWSSLLLYRCCRSGAQGKRLITMGLIVVNLTLLQLFFADSDSAMYSAIFRTTYDALGVSPLIADEFHHQVYIVINVINLLAAMTPAFILVAICGTFSIADHNAEPDIHFIAERINYLKQGVTAGSIVLLFGIIHMVAWMQWPKFLLGESAFAKVFANYIHANSQYWGLTFTLLLLSVYSAAMMALQSRLKEALEAMPNQADKQLWLKDNQSFTTTFQKHALQLGMMLMPTLAGSLDSVFELL